MPRVIKHPDLRRTELLDIAASLFARSGYSATSVDEIIAQAGLSKGAFYHHFPSKEALLDGLAKRAATAAREGLERLLADPDLNAIQRLNGFIAAGRKTETGPTSLRIFASIFKPENLVLYYRLHAAVAEVITEPLSLIIDAGTREGTMRCDDPKATAEIILALGTITHGVVADLLDATTTESHIRAMQAFRRRMEQQGIAVDRILGLPDGTVRYWDAELEVKFDK